MGTGVSPKRIATRNLLLFNCRACRSFLTSNPFHVFSVESIPLIHLPVLMCILRTSFSLCPFALPSVHSLLDSQTVKHTSLYFFFLRKEVIQPHLPIRLPCYDFTPVIGPAFGSSLHLVGSLTSGVTDSHGVTGGVYKTRERIHRGILIRDY